MPEKGNFREIMSFSVVKLYCKFIHTGLEIYKLFFMILKIASSFFMTQNQIKNNKEYSGTDDLLDSIMV